MNAYGYIVSQASYNNSDAIDVVLCSFESEAKRDEWYSSEPFSSKYHLTPQNINLGSESQLRHPDDDRMERLTYYKLSHQEAVQRFGADSVDTVDFINGLSV